MSAPRHSREALLRFADRDAMGHVNSLKLAELIEDARLDFLAGIPQAPDVEWRLVSLRVDFHARSGAMEFARAAHAREPGRGYGMQGNFFPGWTGVYGLETVHGPDALVNPWLRELIGVSGLERIWDWRLYAEPGNAAD